MATGDKKRAVMTDDINNSGSAYPVLGMTGDGSNVTAAFTPAASRTNISTGEKLTVIFGKVAKWFSDLGAAAFRGVDAAPTAGSTNLVESGGVKSAITHDLANIVATGSTNTTGAIISSGTYFYLDGALIRAKANIAVNATFTNGTNYEAVTAGGLNELKAALDNAIVKLTLTKTFSSGYVDIPYSELSAYGANYYSMLFAPRQFIGSVDYTFISRWFGAPNNMWRIYAYIGASPVSAEITFRAVLIP